MEFYVRPWKASDADSLVEHGNNYKIAQFMTDAFPHPYTIEKANAFISYATSANPVTIFAIEIDGQAAGGIGIHPQSDVMCKNAELGYWLSEKYWGNGIITKAVRQMVDYAFQNFDIIRIYARPYGNNKGSQKVLTKAGFELEATIRQNIFKNGEFQDELIYGYRKK